MSSWSLLTVFSLLATSAFAGIGPTATLNIANDDIAPDGLSRSSVLANGVFPAPLITANKGDAFSLTVADKLTDDSMDLVTSIHWHGLFQQNTAYADGVSGVTQCPIIPNNSFDYAFVAPGQAGTFWYYSHYHAQYCDGLRGALVIYDPQDPAASLYDVDDDSTVITLADWYHYTSKNAPAVPAPSSTLINGLGRYSGGPASDLAVVNVVKGTRYRFRLVSISCDTNFIFSIDGHKFSVIEVDSTNHHPLTIDSVQILAGQRYSLVMTADQDVGNYWIRAQPSNINATFDGGLNSAILRYKGATVADPTSTSSLSLQLNEQDLHPLTAVDYLSDKTVGGADVNLELDVSFNAGLFEVNGQSFEAPDVPVLLQILSGTPPASLLPTGSVQLLPKNATIEIAIPGGVLAGPHPVHLHGHTFSVVRSAGNSTYNYENPPIRDVVSIGTLATDRTTIRFRTDNAGPWFLHCHIDWHLTAGFAIVMAEDTPDIPNEDPTDAWNALCPAWNTYSASTGITQGGLKPIKAT
ncbi:multicopper oxidase [Peniophora sp. CONT]|nr:multicopper oxidase [Peniophora sp. CONT]